jgi:acyl carrier protein
MQTTLERVKSLIAENLGISWAEVTDDAKLTTDLDADSLTRVELIIALEEEFDFEIPDDLAEEHQDSTSVSIAGAIDNLIAVKR